MPGHGHRRAIAAEGREIGLAGLRCLGGGLQATAEERLIRGRGMGVPPGCLIFGRVGPISLLFAGKWVMERLGEW
jgi:hypothetical protein